MPPASAETGAAFPLGLLTRFLPEDLQFHPTTLPVPGRVLQDRRWFRCRYCDVLYLGPAKRRGIAYLDAEVAAAWAHEALCPQRDEPVNDPEWTVVWRVYGPILERLVDALNLTPSRIGADTFLTNNPDYDSVAFYQGVGFALARVAATLKADPDKDDR